jgi:anti-sigma factor RsiW
MTVRSGAEFRDLSCDEVVERLPALVAGDLDDLQIAEIEQHTSDCFECDVDLRQSRGLSNALQQLW